MSFRLIQTKKTPRVPHAIVGESPTLHLHPSTLTTRSQILHPFADMVPNSNNLRHPLKPHPQPSKPHHTLHLDHHLLKLVVNVNSNIILMRRKMIQMKKRPVSMSTRP